MRVKDHQRSALLADFRLGGTILIILAFAWAFYLIYVPAQVTHSLAAFFSFLILIAPVILLGNPTLIKVLSAEYASRPGRLWIIPLVLWTFSVLYFLAIAKFNIFLILAGGIYCFLPFRAAQYLIKKHTDLCWGDALIILLVLLPLQFGFLSQYGAPSVQPLFYVYPLIGIINLLIIYLVLRPLPNFVYSFRLKDNDWRTAVMNFLFLFMLVFIPGIALRFFSISSDMLTFGEMMQQLLFIGFFIALPEELLFRGIVQNFIAGRIAGRKNAQIVSLVSASLLSGLAHYHNAFVLDFGSTTPYPGSGQPVWVNILIASVAAMLFGWTVIKTRKVTAAAFVHLLFNWVWLVILNG